MQANDKRIPDGYYIKSRYVENHIIALAPPHVREIWDLLLREANHKEAFINGALIKKGQLLTTYHQIIERLKWQIGWRTERYKKWHCEKAMKWLTKADMIATKKTTRGLFVTILDYETYQNPANYERDSESSTIATRKLQPTATINKNEKNKKKENNNILSSVEEIFQFWNFHKIVIHSDISKHHFAISSAVKKYSLSDIRQAILNYKSILEDGSSWLNKRWTISQFLKQNNALEKFLPINFHKEEYVQPGKVGKVNQNLSNQETIHVQEW